MEDYLDFSANFWENKLDLEPESVDNIYSKKGISYAIDDYCGFDPVSERLQAHADEERQLADPAPANGRDKRRAKTKNGKHNLAAG